MLVKMQAEADSSEAAAKEAEDRACEYEAAGQLDQARASMIEASRHREHSHQIAIDARQQSKLVEASERRAVEAEASAHALVMYTY